MDQWHEHEGRVLSLNVALNNASDQPAYNVMLTVRVILNAGDDPNPFFHVPAVASLGTLKPGYDSVPAVRLPPDPDFDRAYAYHSAGEKFAVVELHFRDAAGVQWTRQSDGTLLEQG
jgi:hypothetical protein